MVTAIQGKALVSGRKKREKERQRETVTVGEVRNAGALRG